MLLILSNSKEYKALKLEHLEPPSLSNEFWSSLSARPAQLYSTSSDRDLQSIQGICPHISVKLDIVEIKPVGKNDRKRKRFNEKWTIVLLSYDLLCKNWICISIFTFLFFL